MGDLVRYQGFVANSARWDGFPFRDGDVVISTPAKCGTTWMQTLVGLLVFDRPDFPAPISELSPWLDMNTVRLEEIVASLEAQDHRRFIKTHTPLDGIPLDPRATYVCVARDPRDAAVSMAHHLDNMNIGRLLELRANAVGLDDLDPSAEPPDTSLDGLDDKLRTWITAAANAGDGMESLAGILHHVTTFWDHRHDPNVALFHYADLTVDLEGQLLRLRDVLGAPQTDARVGELAPEARIEQMRGRAIDVAPNATQDLWKDPARFFRSGTGGEWAGLMTAEDLARYDARVVELVTPDVARWVHGGWLAEEGATEPASG